ncbi:hypothetical protein [Deinococcus soli (ex Cha et al. 2016)]|uniref:Uncharacterized protein n=2 Tax=Deinococcus soli (ex Cha et al. 2016) TaxID=1309411 RepID=A0ACC6KGA3_9DEIO|nr:hypothetical protein [Deinococcus soli (ex Cha et al. 2016)]MDR6218190.1 hypothetical protein [Deinococcus soli (ex Cha et al. 2016)]MDR6328930.1 hypothetical protein [Deinococcus soli (ex Cha et al. 2016)]MDR6751582.1 hypothetical protein [Deinococcus soli (ex Cha et al. 2016)]
MKKFLLPLTAALLLSPSALADHQDMNLGQISPDTVCLDQVVYYNGDKQDPAQEAQLKKVLKGLAAKSSVGFNTTGKNCLAHGVFFVDSFKSDKGFYVYSIDFSLILNAAGIVAGYDETEEEPVEMELIVANPEIWNAGSFGYAESYSVLGKKSEAKLREYFELFQDTWQSAQEEHESEE